MGLLTVIPDKWLEARLPEFALDESGRLFVRVWTYVDQVVRTVGGGNDKRGEILLPEAFGQLAGVGLLCECPDLHKERAA